MPANFIGTGAVSAGTASISTASLSVASHTITAVYTGDGVDINGSTGTLNYVVAQAGTATTVSAAPASGDVFGQSITLSAAISVAAPGSGAINGGNVSFYDGAAIPANLLGTSAAVVNGAASLSTTALSAGSNQTITAVYSGSGNFAGSTGTSSPYSVAQANTSVSVTATPASGALFGQNVTLTANIADTSSAVVVSGGTVSFYDGAAIPANFLGSSAAVAGGAASFTTAALSAGGHSITAVYSGAIDFAGNIGTLGSYAVGSANTSTSAAATPASGDLFGQNVTLTASVVDTSTAAAVNGGTVTFYDGPALPANFLGASGTVTAGAASITTAALAAGSQSITVVYSGAGNFSPSTGMLNYLVGADNTALTVIALPTSSAFFGQSITLSAIVANTSTSAQVNGGTVSFYEGAAIPANLLGTSNPVSAGGASISTAALAIGAGQTITAVYSGSANFAGNAATLSPYAILQDATSTAVTATPASGDLFGQSVTLTATIANSNSPALVNGGAVTFYDGPALTGTLLGTSTSVVNGSASISTTALPPGASHTITAVYSGVADFAGSMGALTGYAVIADSTSTAVAASPSSGAVFGQSVTLTATIANQNSSAVVSGGTVSFYDGAAITANLIGTSGAVAGGAASIMTAALAVSAGHTITAVYSGDGVDFSTSTGMLNSYAVKAVGTQTAVSVSPASGDVFGQSITLTANIATLSPSSTTVAGGTVRFYDGAALPANLLGTSGVVAAGTASIATSALTAAGHTITAVYSGDGLDFNTSTGTLSYAVAVAGTSIAVSAFPANGDVFGQVVALTANVTATGGSTAIVAGGTVSFYDGAPIPANLLGTSGTVSGGTASLMTAALALSPGQTITALYTGSSSFAGSTGTLNSYAVGQAATSTAITSSSIGNTSGAGQAVTFTATVNAASPSTATVNGGTVQFFNGATPLGAPATVTAGVATLATSTLTQGAHAITAVYNAANSGAFAASTSGVLTQEVLANSTVAFTSSTANPSPFGQPVAFAVVVSGNATDGASAGFVTLYDGAQCLPTRSARRCRFRRAAAPRATPAARCHP